MQELLMQALDQLSLGAAIASLLGAVLGAVAIVIAILIYERQTKANEKVKEIIEDMKAIMDANKRREDFRKRYYLIRISSYTELIKKDLLTLLDFIEKFEKEQSEGRWKIVTNYVRYSQGQIRAWGQVIKDDFEYIKDLIQDQYLIDKSDVINVVFSEMALDRVPVESHWQIALDDLDEPVQNIKDQAAKLDETISRIEDEIPKAQS